jgi:uncharacterized membrane-anchored protein YhcB (DUF1043 family)
MQPDFGWGIAGVGAVLTVGAYFLGRWRSGERARALESDLKVTRDELEHAVLEVESLRGKLSDAQSEYDDYRMNVLEHFSGTSDLLRDLTVQYRSVYEHLTKGASTLCPEGFVGLTEGLPKPQLASATSDMETEADEETTERNSSGDEETDSRATGSSLSA